MQSKLKKNSEKADKYLYCARILRIVPVIRELVTTLKSVGKMLQEREIDESTEALQ